MAHFASANLPCALAMCCFIIAQMSVPIGEYPRIYSCPFTSAFLCPRLQCALASAHVPVPTPLAWPTPVPWPFAASLLVSGLCMGKWGVARWYGMWAWASGPDKQACAHRIGPMALPLLQGETIAPRARCLLGARRCNLCGYVVRRAIYAGLHFTLGASAHWPMCACAIT